MGPLAQRLQRAEDAREQAEAELAMVQHGLDERAARQAREVRALEAALNYAKALPLPYFEDDEARERALRAAQIDGFLEGYRKGAHC